MPYDDRITNKAHAVLRQILKMPEYPNITAVSRDWGINVGLLSRLNNDEDPRLSPTVFEAMVEHGYMDKPTRSPRLSIQKNFPHMAARSMLLNIDEDVLKEIVAILQEELD